MDSTTHRWFLPEGRSKRETVDSFVLPALVMPGGGSGKTYESDLQSIAGSRRASVASVATYSTVKGSQQQKRLSQADYFTIKGTPGGVGNGNDGGMTPRDSVATDIMSPFTPSPSMFPAPPGSNHAIQIAPRSRTSLQPIPASPLTSSWPSPTTPHRAGDAAEGALSPALSGHTLVSPTNSGHHMQRPEKAYSPIQEGRPQVSRFTSSETTTSVMTAQSTTGLAPLTRQQGNNRESWQSGRTVRSSKRRSAAHQRSSLQPVGDYEDNDAMEKGSAMEISMDAAARAESPLPPPPPFKNYTTFTGFRPYSVHSSYTYVDDGESEVGVPPPSGMGGVAGKPVFMGSDGLPVRPTAEMQQRARRRKITIRWMWAIGVLCFIAIVVGVSVGLINAFSAPKS
ncbi:uncharacterized protein B0I36DRAFT_358961 [Microdochium trichocladiopsis]|uniref:Uncharacterized protein n=1 Tax=Microdochium trichocladiopsis TaxID=1682393 RepID=A0A9P8YDH5_9PEZI|nr:uncharacterized protein B0I36DRAFT_358961 [Microdochium trichocladiopsis]KAH7037234.1 hypothetical protein B0I36DRAFT_358961 [Microdochium trichocladiopsis]